MNAFKKNLHYSVSEEKAKEDIYSSMISGMYKYYLDFYGDSYIQEYLNTVVASILMTYHKRFDGFTVEIPYRFKAPASVRSKLENYSHDLKKVFGPIKPIKDNFAMKVVSYNFPPSFFSKDAEIMNLIIEKQENYAFLGEMQKFKSSLVKDDFSRPPQFLHTCTKLEYLQNCKKVLQKIITLLNPQAVNLISYYENLLHSIDNSLEFVSVTDVTAKIDDDDLTNSEINFFKLLDDFSSRIPDKLDLAILTKQVSSLFENNEIFKSLGISLCVTRDYKRTENGFVSNFLYINTLVGKIECQIQSFHEFEESNFGFTAHANLTGKSIKPLPIPSLNDKKQIKEFIAQIHDIAPKSYVARMDTSEKDRVLIHQSGDYQNYKNVTSQVTRGGSLEKYLHNYFSKLYAIKDSIFHTSEKTLSYMDSDIYDYIHSERFQEFKKTHTPNIDSELDK